ncbi:MAG: HAD family phosphatase [Bacteroidales bacterium]
MHIKTIVFDIGNVLISFRPEVFHRERGVSEEKTAIYLNDIYHGLEWQMIDRGVMTIPEAIRSIAGRSSLSTQEIAGIFTLLEEILFPLSENGKLLKPLKKAGFRLYYLSNFAEEMFARVFRKNDFFSHFNGGILSASVKMLKPEPEIYHELIRKYDIIPAETLFIDDLPANIEAAGAEGFQTLYLPDHTRLREELLRVLPGAEL